MDISKRKQLRRGKKKMEDLKLFGNRGSPFSHRAEVALRLKGVKYEFVHEDLANKSEMLLKFNPIHKKVPVLVQNNRAICESLIVVEYIDETFEGHSLLPSDPYERATARFWAKFIDEKVMPSFWMSCWTDGEMQTNFISQAKESMEILQKQLDGKKFFGGDSIGFVDIASCNVAFWFGVLQEVAGLNILNEDDFPVLCRWAKDYCEDGNVKEILPPREMLLGFFMSRKDRIFATKAPVYD